MDEKKAMESLARTLAKAAKVAKAESKKKKPDHDKVAYVLEQGGFLGIEPTIPQ